jgi:hypothetical protein
MIKKEIEISVDASKAEAGLDDIATSIQDLNKEVTSFAKKGDKAIDDLSKSAKSAEKNTKTLAEGFKGAGLALKAMGIGLVIEGMQMLKEVFMSNQTVADGFSAVMGTISSVFSQVSNVIVSVTEKVNKNSKGFEGLTNVIKGLMTIALTPLKLAFYNVQLALNGIQLAWEESIFGDGDPKRIKELKKRIEDAALSIKETGKDAVKAGVQVATNLGKAGKEVGQVVSGTIDGVSKINVAATYEQSKANVRLQNTAKLAEANQARLVEQYDRQAEKLRQVRDEERNTLDERITANNKLKDVLNNQEKAMLAQADAQIAAARMTYNQNKNIENQVALTNALANREGVLAQVEGLRSEQKANDLALNRELIELDKTKLDTATELAINQKLFDAERIKDTVAKLEAEKMAIQEQERLELERLQKNIDSYKVGTIARVEAEKEYALKKQELDNAITAKEDEIALTKYEKSVEQTQKIIDNDKMAFDARFAALTEQENLIKNNTVLSEEERTKALADNTKARIELTKAESEYRIAQAQEVGNALGALGDLVGKQTAAGKALGIAQALINTYIGVTEILRQKSVLPSPADYIAKAINVAATLASGFKAVKAITSVKVPGGGGGGNTPAGFGTAGGASPSFNVVGNSGVNALAQTIGTQTQKPLQAYVVAQNVTTAQSLNRNIIQSATLG